MAIPRVRAVAQESFLHFLTPVDHCSAIALAIPEYVLDLSRDRFGSGGMECILCSLPDTIFVGLSFGRFLSHRHVAFVSPCPNCQGCMIWSGFRYSDDIIPMGFSMAIRGIGALTICIKKSMASFCCVTFCENHLAPDTARCVHGGKAIIMSQPSCKRFKTSS